MDKKLISWQEFGNYAENLSNIVKSKAEKIDLVIGIARGGLPVSMVLADRLGVPLDFINIKSYKGIGIRDRPKILAIMYKDLSDKSTILVDDIVDEGDTMIVALDYINKKFNVKNVYTATIFIKPWSRFKPDFYVEEEKRWIVFPWEVGEFIKN